jgi:hypothetical protein
MDAKSSANIWSKLSYLKFFENIINNLHCTFIFSVSPKTHYLKTISPPIFFQFVRLMKEKSEAIFSVLTFVLSRYLIDIYAQIIPTDNERKNLLLFQMARLHLQ